MTKKTKRILLWAVGIWVGICLIYAAFSAFSEVSNTKTETVIERMEAATGTKTINIEDDEVLMRVRMLYRKLMTFKDSRDFHLYGFGEGGDYHGWYMASHNFTEEDDRYLMRNYAIVSGDLRMLGDEYLTSKGKETEYSRGMRETLDRIFSSTTWEVSE